MPSSRQKATMSSTRSIPRRCPSMRDKPFNCAQRPLPSMMMAICWGTFLSSKFTEMLNLHDLFLFMGKNLVYLGDILVGHFLDLGLGLLELVFGKLAVLLELLDRLIPLASGVPDRNAGILRHFFCRLHELLPAFLR